MNRPGRQRLVTVLVALVVPVALGGAGCDRHDDPVAPDPVSGLRLVRSVPLSVAEPSDLCLDRDGVHWWTVSDATGRVYRMRLSDGAIVTTLSYQGSDLEGVWQHPGDGSLYVTEEGTREIVHLDSTGVELGRVAVAGLGGDANSGLEGVTSGPVAAHLYVVQEKSPARIVEVASDGSVVAMHPVTFVADLSGITYDAAATQFLIVSDESEQVHRTTVSGVSLASWSLPVEKAEGIAFDRARGRIYVVSDSQNRFYEFQVP